MVGDALGVVVFGDALAVTGAEFCEANTGAEFCEADLAAAEFCEADLAAAAVVVVLENISTVVSPQWFLHTVFILSCVIAW